MSMTPHNLDTIIVGLGPTGLSVARYLGRKGIAFAVTDSRPQPPGMEALKSEFPAAPYQFGAFAEDFFAPAKRLIVSPGVAVATPVIQAAQARGVEILGDVELFVREAKAPIVAVTGSNGKSSVTKLVEEMAQQAGLRCYAVGNIGRFVMDALTDPVPDLYVMELSSFQLETTRSLSAAAATVLNISEDHMDRYDSLDDYAAAKAVIYQHCGHAVANREDSRVMQMVAELQQPVSCFGLAEPGSDDYGIREQDGVRYLARGQHCLMPVSEMRLPGDHHALNALAALALGAAVGLPEAAMLNAVRVFSGLPHRTEWVRERRGVNWFNDSKGTNVGATVAALQGLPGKTVLIAGGQGKGADFKPLGCAIREHARAVVLMGEDAGLIAAVVGDAVPHCQVGSMQEAVLCAAEFAWQGDNVLLSPACASFDMFSNYIQRGERFSTAVRELAA